MSTNGAPVPAEAGLLCTIDQTAGNGGIARVSVLIGEVMRKLSAGCQTLTLLPPGRCAAMYRDKARFTSRLIVSQFRREFHWLLFDHISLSLPQLIVPLRYRTPYAVFLHSIEVWNALSASKLRALNEATVLIANSEYTATRVRAAHPNVGPIEVCHLALSPELQPTTSRTASVDTDLIRRIRTNSVAIVGRVSSAERHKGHLQLIRSWPKILERVPDAQLIVVGRGDDLPYLENQARIAGCQEAVLFTGWVNDQTLAALYDRVAVYAMPSDGEGFGVVFLEAMKHSLPCIASPTDASREIVLDGKTGYLVNQKDHDALVAKIVHLLDNPPLRHRLGEAGFQRLNNCFSFELFERRLLGALQPLLYGRGSAEKRTLAQ